MEFAAKFNWEFLSHRSFNLDVFRYVLKFVPEIRNNLDWLTNPKKLAENVYSLGIDDSKPLLVIKSSHKGEYLVGAELNYLRENNICPGVLYTYAMLEEIITPVSTISGTAWNYHGTSVDLLLEYIPGTTFDDVIEVSSNDFVAILIQIVITLWIINDRYNRIHYDLHGGNILLRQLDNHQWIHYKTPTGNRWIYSSYIATIIDYADLNTNSFDDEDDGSGELVGVWNTFLNEHKNDIGENIELMRNLMDKLNDKDEPGYQNILNAILELIETQNIYSEEEQHIIKEDLEKWRSITSIRQACALKSVITLNMINKFNMSLEKFGDSFNLGIRNVVLYENDMTHIKDYLTAMISIADDLNSMASYIRTYRCVDKTTDLMEIENYMRQCRDVYLQHHTIMMSIIKKRLVPFSDDPQRLFDKYEIWFVEPYINISESVFFLFE